MYWIVRLWYTFLIGLNVYFMEVLIVKLKDISGYMAVDCEILVEDATNDEYSYVDDFPLKDAEKMKRYKDATLTTIAPGNNGNVLVSVCINYGIFTEN